MRSLISAIVIPFALCWSSLAAAHEIRPAIVTVTFNPDASYQIEIVANMEAVLAGVSPKHTDTDESPNARNYNQLRALAPAELEQRIRDFEDRFTDGLTVEWDGLRVRPRIAAVRVAPQADAQLARLTSVTLSGEIPPGAREFTWAYAADYGANVLKQRNEGDAQFVSEWLEAGARSKPFAPGIAVTPKSRGEIAGRYLELGFTHILPKGLDHILFVLGLFLLSARWKPLLAQVTAFTAAHTITLALTIYGVLSLSPAIVEPLIAASIVYVAAENILTAELKPWRVFVVFGFGLLHGMGFAGVLNEVGLPRSEFLTALLAFNAGVELGQLTVIALAFLAAGLWFRKRAWYRRAIVVPASTLIALTGLYWTVERVFFI